MIQAIVGSGGKTSHIKKLAQIYHKQNKKVLIITSTHMMKESDTLVSDDLNEILDYINTHDVVHLGSNHGIKIGPVSKEILNNIIDKFDEVLIEADGSKCLPLKYPNDNEPVIYDCVDKIIVKSSLYGLHKPLDEVTHRIELARKCLKVDNLLVESQHIQQLVEEGYMKKLEKQYPDKEIELSIRHNGSLYERCIAAIMEAREDVSLIDESWFEAKPTLIICGAGHVGKELAYMSTFLDFDIRVIDDRKEFIDAIKHDNIQASLDTFDHLDQYLVDQGYYVVVTRGHSHDLTCCDSILKSNYRYLGMIGSKKKVIQTKENLKNLGHSQDKIDSIYAPIGLSIQASTPAEIAVSILGQIIQIKNSISKSSISRTLLETKKEGVLCIVIEKQGSAPRGVGSMMLVCDDEVIDTIGGGIVENQAIQHARTVKQFDIKTYNLNNETSKSLGMICGGLQKVLFIRI